MLHCRAAANRPPDQMARPARNRAGASPAQLRKARAKDEVSANPVRQAASLAETVRALRLSFAMRQRSPSASAAKLVPSAFSRR